MQRWKMQQVMAILSKIPSPWDAPSCTSAGQSRFLEEPRPGVLCSHMWDDWPGIAPQLLGSSPPALLS